MIQALILVVISQSVSVVISQSVSATPSFEMKYGIGIEELHELGFGVGIGVIVAASASILDKPINDLSKRLQLDELGEILSLPGDVYFILPFTIAGYASGIIFKDDKLKLIFLRAGISLALTTATVQLIKFSGRFRPYASSSGSPYNFSFLGLRNYNRSFPSGHSQASAAVYITIGNNICESTLCKIPFLTLPFLVGIGRILAQDHWFSDVLGGIIIGSCFELF